MKVYIVEDDENIREIESYALKKADFEVEAFENGEQCLAACDHELPDVLLLDIMLPGKSGLEVLKELRENEKSKNLIIMMVSAKGSEVDKVLGLDTGADDYISKPFGTMELVSRVKALTRRLKSSEQLESLYKCKGIELDKNSRRVTVDGRIVELTFKEFELLRFLMGNQGTVMSRSQLLEGVWGFDFAGESRTVDMHIKTLRHKLGESGSYIKTIRNVGYVIE